MRSIIFSSRKEAFLLKDGQPLEFNSRYIEKHIENLRSLRTKNEWKNKGAGSSFMFGDGIDLPDEESAICALCGISPLNDEEFLYSAIAGDTSGIFIKSLLDVNAPEKHMIHSQKGKFGAIDYSKKLNLFTSSIQNGEISNIAVFDIERQDLITLTDGDSVDENPSIGARSQLIYFNTRGVGRGNYQQILGYSPSSICAISRDGATFKEVFSLDNFDLIKPKEDENGNIYFIKTPIRGEKKGGSVTFGDVLLAPFRLIKALFGFLNIKSMQYGGQALATGGNNPAKNRQKGKQELIIEGNVLDAQKNISENQKKGDKFAGYAPRSWELMRLKPNGEMDLIRKGVLDYCLDENGEILFSNGRFIVRICGEGKEEQVYKGEDILKLTCF